MSAASISALQESLQAITDKVLDPDISVKDFFEGPYCEAWCSDDRDYYINYYSKDGMREQFKRDFLTPASVALDAGRGCYRISFGPGRQRCSFSIEGDPVCCGVSYIYGFSISDKFDPVLLKEAFDIILPWAPANVGAARNGRFFINMVERGRYCKDPLNPPEMIDKPQIQYQPLYDFLKSYCAKINTTLCPNVNTGNIIHHMECLFDQSKLKL